MTSDGRSLGVYLSGTLDLEELYGADLTRAAAEGEGAAVEVRHPDQIADPSEVSFAVCWLPEEGAFAPYPNLGAAMSIGAGVDALMSHPGLPETAAVTRVRDPHQADMMAGYALHEILHRERRFPRMAANAAARRWQPLPMRAPRDVTVAVLGHGTMGRAVARASAAMGFTTRVACRSTPAEPLAGVDYCAGDDGIARAAEGADYVVNVLPLTPETESVLDAELFARLAEGAWLVQIGRGEHLDEVALTEALDAGRLAGASLDVFRTEPLPEDHPFWSDARLRITPHVASDATPAVVAEQIVTTARELEAGRPLSFAVARERGY